MPISLAFAQHADAARIAEIHMAAFGSNEMLLAQFPTSFVRDALKKCIELKASADIDDPKTTVLIIRDSISGGLETKIIAFAKWSLPVPVDENYTEPPWIWPPGTNLKILDGWTEKSEEAQSRAVGDAPCYRLTFMGTDPEYERRGAARMMVQWGIEQCKKEDVPAYLESTLEAAPFYRRLGFVDVEKFSLEYRISGYDMPKVYEEISFIYR
ncbi:putative GNAT family acetyltransferase [Hypoxylon crocopeplum]|nr:putative GNAT family acetyltransferase [Hypoxylon crocopeplum]